MKKSNFNNTAKCDVCLSPVSAHNGFILPTKTIVSISEYWEKSIDVGEERGYNLPSTPFEILLLLVNLAGQENEWLVCDKCSEMYEFDKEKAKIKAETWWGDRTPIYCGGLCTVSADSKKVIVSDNESFGLAYSAARETFSKYWFQQFFIFTSTNTMSRKNVNIAELLFKKSSDCMIDASDLFEYQDRMESTP